MLFNSVTYLLAFLPIVTILYWRLPKRPRMWLIFSSSIVFYGFWRFDFVPLVIFSALLDYYLALWIDKAKDPLKRKRLLFASVAANLLILGFFKYLVFFVETGYSLARLLGYEPGFVELKIILPLGISFYIFQTLSYTIDVYRRELPPERDMLKYMCFVTFFGHMVAGPILRAPVLLPQFETRPKFRGEFVTEGIMRILAGLFLKVVLADTAGEFVDAGFARPPGDLSFIDAWTLAFLFGFQIYFDFAGYSHIAIGSALLLGITLPENFNYPYMSTSPREFWQRWHISLSTWIRDYLYLPILGSYRSARDDAWDTLQAGEVRVTEAKRSYSLFLTWMIMGLWHGANWTFAVWGLYHALLVQAHRFIAPWTRSWNTRAWTVAGFAVTLPLSMAGWVPFRSLSLTDTVTMWGRMLDLSSLMRLSYSLPTNGYLFTAFLLIGMVLSWMWATYVAPKLHRHPVADAVAATVYVTVAASFAFVFLQVRAQFIYFQF